MIKGIMRPTDARRAVDIGATRRLVLHHGGNNLDGTPASIRAASGGRGGGGGSRLRCCSTAASGVAANVVKALGAGARAVMMAAPRCGPGRRRPSRRRQRLEILRSGIDSALLV